MERVSDYARSVLLEPSLDAKLRAPPSDLVDDAGSGSDGAPVRTVDDMVDIPRAPARDPTLAMVEINERLPRPGELGEAGARAACLSRFAHHELQAIELFAWALLAFPDLPPGLRRGFVQALGEEQEHCRLYLDRLAAHDVIFGSLPLSGYFWRHIDRIADAPSPALAFLCAQGLTLEQANLDFTLLFRDGFRSGGDDASARVMQRVHDDEIGHVKLAVTWVRRLAGTDEVTAYAAHAPFPFSLARAKARRFDVGARRRAGLSDALIEAVRAARPYA